MAVSKMIWRPDTCGCVIEETHDPQNPTYGVQFSGVISKCPAHSAIADAALFGVVHDGENRRKNLIHKYLLETSALALSQTDSGGSLVLKPGITFNWSFDASRALVVSVTGATITNAQKTTLRAYCTTIFGANKVTVL